jgi:hypothetical protein
LTPAICTPKKSAGPGTDRLAGRFRARVGLMISGFRSLCFVAALCSANVAAPAMAGSCTGIVVGVGPFDRYSHETGVGFLAVRTGPGVDHTQVGELYPGDLVTVSARAGKWYEVGCMSGRCVEPVWGKTLPFGWASGYYLKLVGDCP